MRKLLYTLAGLSALALFASCNKEAQLLGGEDGATVKASFTVQLPDAVQTKAISDGLGATQLLFKVYDQSDKHLPNLDQTITVSDRKATVTVNLVKGVKYQYVFWAQTPNQYTLDADNATLTITPADMMNSDAWDAFYWHEPLEEVTAAFSKTITLRRPFAQINVGAPVTLDAGVPTGGDFWAASQSNILTDDNLTTSYTIEVPNKLNLLDGSVDGAASVTMNAVAHPTEFLTVDGVKYDYAAMAYVLAGTTGTTKDLVLKLNTKQNGTDIELTRNVPNVPLRRNYRTNILGNVFTVTGTFNIVVDQKFFKVDGYNDDYFPQYASIDALNAAFAAGKGIGYTVEVAPAAAVSGPQTIVLPNTQDEVSIFFRGDFSAADITIAYSSEAEAKKPAKLTIEAPLVGSATKSINKLVGNLPATTVVLAGTTTVDTADFHTASNTLHIMPEAKILNQLTVYAGSLLVEGFIETAIIDPAVAVNTVDAVATVAEDGEVVRFVVQNLTAKIESGAKVGTLEVIADGAGATAPVTIAENAVVSTVEISAENGAEAPTVVVNSNAEVNSITGDTENVTDETGADLCIVKNLEELQAAITANKTEIYFNGEAIAEAFTLKADQETVINGLKATKNVSIDGEKKITLNKADIQHNVEGAGAIEVLAGAIAEINDSKLVSTAANPRGVMLDENSTLFLNGSTVDVGKGSGSYPRAIQFNAPGVTANINDCKISAGHYAINFIGDSGNAKVSFVKTEIVTGWAILNIWSSGNEIQMTDCVCNSLNDKTYNADGWNDFAAYVFNHDASYSADNNIVNVINSVNQVESTTGNRQNLVSIRYYYTTQMYNAGEAPKYTSGNKLTFSGGSIIGKNTNTNWYDNQTAASIINTDYANDVKIDVESFIWNDKDILAEE